MTINILLTQDQINTKWNSINNSEIYDSTFCIMDVASQKVDDSVCAAVETGLLCRGK